MHKCSSPTSGLDDLSSGLDEFTLQYTRSTSPNNVPWLRMGAETELAINLASKANVVWTIFEGTNHPSALSTRKAASRRTISYPTLLELDKHRLAAEAAMKTFRLVSGLSRRAGERQAGSGRGNGGWQ